MTTLEYLDSDQRKRLESVQYWLTLVAIDLARGNLDAAEVHERTAEARARGLADSIENLLGKE